MYLLYVYVYEYMYVGTCTTTYIHKPPRINSPFFLIPSSCVYMNQQSYNFPSYYSVYIYFCRQLTPQDHSYLLFLASSILVTSYIPSNDDLRYILSLFTAAAGYVPVLCSSSSRYRSYRTPSQFVVFHYV